MAKLNGKNNLVEDLSKHEMDIKFNQQFRKSYFFPRNLVDRLNLESELKGHEGCVNCLEWNQYGTMLASGSDDLKINLWDPFKQKLVHSIETKHRGNIFSVKYLPMTNDSLIASCAADRDIYVYDLNRCVNINEIHTHQNRVKRLATAKDVPFLFWSAGEDGLVLEHDIRCSPNEASRILLNFSKGKSNSYSLEAKCVAVNPIRSELIAVGTNDPFGRVYDRRMIKTKSITNRPTQPGSSRLSDLSTNSTTSATSSSYSSTKPIFEFSLDDDVNTIPLTYYVPGHLPKRIDEYRKRMKTLSVTFLSFSPNGNELLVNLGGEQLYLYDLFKSESKFNLKYDSYRDLFDLSGQNESNKMNEASGLSRESSAESLPKTSQQTQSTDILPAESKTTTNETQKSLQKKKYKLPPKAEKLKTKANTSFEEQNYVEAIDYYNEAIRIAPDSPILYGNRAAALMKRNWEGDVYAAMLDCYMALNLDNNHLKSHFRLARCLNELKWHEEAKECLSIFRKRFPDYADSQACDNLINEIKNALTNKKKNNEKLKKQSESTTRKSKASRQSRWGPSPFYRFLSREEEASDSDDSDEEIEEFKDANEMEESDDDDESLANEGKSKRPIRKKRCDSNNNTSYNRTETSESKESVEENLVELKRIKSLNKIYKKVKQNPIDFKSRYCGHCNVATDIKEANFIGENYICAGSDDGSFFIWDKTTTNVVRVLKGDESIVNCLQPNPFTPMLATSGIDPYVRIWTPKFFDNESGENERVVQDIKSASLNNQLQMNSHPFEFLLLNLTQNPQSWDTEEDSNQNQQSVACRPS